MSTEADREAFLVSECVLNADLAVKFLRPLRGDPITSVIWSLRPEADSVHGGIFSGRQDEKTVISARGCFDGPKAGWCSINFRRLPDASRAVVHSRGPRSASGRDHSGRGNLRFRIRRF